MIGLLVVQALRVAGCKQIIAKDGALSGYGGGVWRKQQLLDLEPNGETSGKPLKRAFRWLRAADGGHRVLCFATHHHRPART
jgi:hypothetical protein